MLQVPTAATDPALIVAQEQMPAVVVFWRSMPAIGQ
jgi:hypothetical protein